VKVAAVQMPHGPSLEENLATARTMLVDAAARGAEIALLPEYWFQPPLPPAEAAAAVSESIAREDELLAFLADASTATGMAVVGNTLNRTAAHLRNVLRVADAGRIAWSQPKLHPMPGERGWGVQGGPRIVAHPQRGAVVGGLVCADILYPEAARILALRGAEVVLNPVLSAWRADDPT